jgi:hypothetical protein
MQHTLADGWGIANRVAVAVVGVVVGGEGEGGVQVSFCATKKERGGVVCFGGGSKKKNKTNTNNRNSNNPYKAWSFRNCINRGALDQWPRGHLRSPS